MTAVFLGLFLGLAAGLQPGAFQTYLMGRTLAVGARRAVIAAFAPLVSDVPVVVLVLFALAQLPPVALRVVAGAGGCFALYLAYDLWRAPLLDTAAHTAATSPLASLAHATLVNALNPGAYLYWSLVAGPAFTVEWAHSPSRALGFLVGFYGALTSTNVGLVLAFGLLGRLPLEWRRRLVVASCVVLASFGLLAVGRAVLDS